MPAILLLIPFILQIAQSEWIRGSPNLPRSDYGMAVGSYNTSIYLMGGWLNKRQSIEYKIDDAANFTDHNTDYLTKDTYGSGQYYTAIGAAVYLIQYPDGDGISVFNMMTKSFIDSSINLQINVGSYSCLAANMDYLFVVGGYNGNNGRTLTLNHLQIWDKNTLQWLSNVPSMQQSREDHSCIIDPISHRLYAIAGYESNGNGYLRSIESIDINNITQRNWKYVGNLTDPALYTRAVLWSGKILVIGGYYYDGSWHHVNRVHIIYTNNNTITVSPHTLSYGVVSVSAIIVDATLYVFGGYGGNGVLNEWMRYDLLLLGSESPTNEPSINPTSNPFTIEPSTNIPTTASPSSPEPSSNPSNDPTAIPITNKSTTTTTPSSMFEENTSSTLSWTPSTTSDPTNEPASPTSIDSTSSTLSWNISTNTSQTAEPPLVIISLGVICTFLLFVIILLWRKKQRKNPVIIKENVEMVLSQSNAKVINENKSININVNNQDIDINNIPNPNMIDDAFKNMERKISESNEESEQRQGEIATDYI